MIAAVAAGSALGGVLRYAVGEALATTDPRAFPWGTFTVNLLGCLLAGALAAWSHHLGATTRLFLAVGFCGGFTTFSAFSVETMRLLDSGSGLRAATYVLASVVAGTAAAAAGFVVARSAVHR